MKKNILITGGTGYIGSHAVVCFEEAGYNTVIVDNLCNSSVETLEGIKKIIGYSPDFFEIDLRDTEKLKQLFLKYDFDGVIHFAGLKAVGESCEKPLEYFDNNIVGSLRLFECMQEFGVKNILFSSSATVYNPENFTEGKGVDEQGICGETTNPYGTSKYLLERVLRDLSSFADFSVMNLRYFNPVGAHPSGHIGEYPDDYPNNLLPYIMKVACGELPHLNVFGDDYETRDGTGVRDYIDVCDLIDGHLEAYKKLESGDNVSFTSYNLGVGRGVSVLELVTATELQTGKKIPYEIVDRRSGDIGEVFCNPRKAGDELGWKALTTIEESVKNSYRFSDTISGKK